MTPEAMIERMVDALERIAELLNDLDGTLGSLAEGPPVLDEVETARARLKNPDAEIYDVGGPPRLVLALETIARELQDFNANEQSANEWARANDDEEEGGA